MSTAEPEFRTQVLLSIQRALWDMVTPELRGVAVGWDKRTVDKRTVSATFLYDEPLSAEMWEIVREVETYVIADFDSTTATDFAADYLPADKPRQLEAEQWWAYLRRED